MRLYTDSYTAYDLTTRLRSHIKVKHYDSTNGCYIGNTQKLLPKF